MRRILPMALMVALPIPALAFCGFFVSGAGGSLYANATMVVMMREGTETVLSMQNNYQGPPEDFAMVVPVPVVLQKEDVKTLPKEVFTHVDTLAAPRLVEYWEQDPCYLPPPMPMLSMAPSGVRPNEGAASRGSADLGVKIEAQFAVGEYDVVVLSAKDSGGLETWLHQEHYNIPNGASEVLRPYVQAGTRFFVAKVDVNRVKFENDHVVLSPLRFQYNTDRFELPVRLGLLNSQGTQDLIVHILARNQRYEAANYDNVTIPTNRRADPGVANDFGNYYEDLFQSAIAAHPRAVVTEYSWSSASCDPCPTPPLSPADILTLGGDTLPDKNAYGWVLTRLHYRYSSDTLGEDLMFKAAPGLQGGTGIPDPAGNLSATAESPYNMFQGRYVMLHPWEGPVACEHPNRGRWGGPPDGHVSKLIPATNRLLGSGAVPRLKGGASTAIPEAGGTSSIPEVGGTNTIAEVGGNNASNSPSTNGGPIPEAAPPAKRGCDTVSEVGIFAVALAVLLGLWRRMKTI